MKPLTHPADPPGRRRASSLSALPEGRAADQGGLHATRERMEPVSLFVAHQRRAASTATTILPDAAAGGAVAALVERAAAAAAAQPAPDPGRRHAHARWASSRRYVRKQLQAKVIAVAGSNGKTSTKHLIDAALRGKLTRLDLAQELQQRHRRPADDLPGRPDRRTTSCSRWARTTTARSSRSRRWPCRTSPSSPTAAPSTSKASAT